MKALTTENHNKESGFKGCTNKVRKSIVTTVSKGAYCTLPSMTGKHQAWVSDNWKVKNKMLGEILTSVQNSGHTSYMHYPRTEPMPTDREARYRSEV
jgi:hypothetical protein